jgi:hypothetical protein
MNDERILLEQRVAWLELKMVRLIWAAIGVVSLGIGFVAYILTVDHFGGLGAFGFAVISWVVVGWYLKRSEFKGSPAHIKLIGP